MQNNQDSQRALQYYCICPVMAVPRCGFSSYEEAARYKTEQGLDGDILLFDTERMQYIALCPTCGNERALFGCFTGCGSPDTAAAEVTARVTREHRAALAEKTPADLAAAQETVAAESPESEEALIADIRARRQNMGSISSGSLRDADLIPAFAAALDEQRDLSDAHKALVKEADEYSDQDHDDDDPGDGPALVEQLMDALNEHAPEGFYFGANQGDGADFGFWLSPDWLEDYDGLKVDDLSDVPDEHRGQVLEINDHGNMTLYWKTADALVEQWGVV